jgi:TonB family protein
MKLPSGKRFGQSGQQLTTAVLFSSILHAILFLTILFFHFAVWPRVSIQPFYAVKLVGLPPDAAAPAPSVPTPAAPPVQKPAERPAPAKPKAPKKAGRAPKAAGRDALPDLAAKSGKKSEAGQERPQEAETTQPATAGTGQSDSVSPVVAQQSDFKFGWYLERVRSKIGQNWNPPPDARDARVRVVFSVNRSGWVGEVNLIDKESSGTFQFQRAAIRAIRASNPFPPLPEEFSRQTLEFSVDLMAVEQ